MATTPDVTLTPNAYTDIYTTLDVVVGTELIIQNKTSDYIKIQEKATEPLSSNEEGIYLESTKWALITKDSSKIWIKGNGRISIQVID